MSNKSTEPTYCLIRCDQLEKLLLSKFLLSQSTLLFEHLCSQSDRPMFLSAGKVCQVLGLTREQLEQSRRKRIIRARAVQNQMMYNAYDLIALTGSFYRRKLQRELSKIPKYVARSFCE